MGAAKVNAHFMFLFDGIDWALSARDILFKDTSSTTILHQKVSWNGHFVDYNTYQPVHHHCTVYTCILCSDYVHAGIICKEADKRLDNVNDIVDIDKEKKRSKNRAMWTSSKDCGTASQTLYH